MKEYERHLTSRDRLAWLNPTEQKRRWNLRAVLPACPCPAAIRTGCNL